MSQDYFDPKAIQGSQDSSSRADPEEEPVPTSIRPNFMTVGSGPTPESAARLAALLDDDSGYGGSVNSGWHPGPTVDRPTPSHTPYPQADGEGESARHNVNAYVLQLQYNQNRTTLSRAIQRTVDTLKELQKQNLIWPAHYPQVQRSEPVPPNRADPDPELHRTQTAPYSPPAEEESPEQLFGPRYVDTLYGEDATSAESSQAAARRTAPEPRLVDAQLAEEFSILKIDLKLGELSQTELVHSLEKTAIAKLLDNQINKSMRHLYSLRERIEDKSSKVLVTGDLNAGKSTFCNALLRRRVLPVDQQPCTEIFCEVLDVRENDGREEVHAIPHGLEYNRQDERTYHVFELGELEQIVTDHERWSKCKVYIKDARGVNESLLNNSIIDIVLIDGPGLNNDSIHTTALFARQEEIDVVVFVVSAANHFTQSAKEFIRTAAQEKAYIFMVVNGFDNIRDQVRCRKLILDQVSKMSPATHKDRGELVHFVSSQAIPISPTDLSASGGGSSSGSGFDDPGNGPDGDDDGDPNKKHGEPGNPADKGKGKEREKMRDFEGLESSLRRFVLEKRARSKLAPARTYLLKVLGDLNSLASVNEDVAQKELDRVTKELRAVEPEYERSKKDRTEVSERADGAIEETVSDVYEHTRHTLDSSIAHVSEQDFGIQYPGFLRAYQFADDIKYAMLQEISDSLDACEDYARNRTASGFSAIKSLGLLHIGDNYESLIFHSDKMFKKKRHALARQVDVDVEPWDFFDIQSLWERQEKLAGTSMAVTVAGVIGSRLIGGAGWVDGALGVARIMGSNNLRKMIVPGLVLTVAIGISYAIASIPKSLPRRLSGKLSAQLVALDYTHSNALRISSDVRRTLKVPADDLRIHLQRKVETLQVKRDETTKFKTEAEGARKYFSNLFRDSRNIRDHVQSIELERIPLGMAVEGH